jgi:hypothetical protein
MSNIKHTGDSWNYFESDPGYTNVLQQRLSEAVEMDSAKAMSKYLQHFCQGDLNIADFGGGPGHYFPVIKNNYLKGKIKYKSIDIDQSNISFGSKYFLGDPDIKFTLGSVLFPEEALDGENCIISANTLPHLPEIKPLLNVLNRDPRIRYFVFRMLIGCECVQIKKHLSNIDFSGLFETGYQFNNIYSEEYIRSHVDQAWKISVMPDIYDDNRLKVHRIPGREDDSFYKNRVSTSKHGMIFKGEIYMPWKFVLGVRH